MKWFIRKNKRHPQETAFDFHVRLGDVANSRKQWDVAANHYQDALNERPDDSAIHIQLGHSLKEQGFLKEAEDAYRNAVKADNTNADAYLHLGHISKLQKHVAATIEAYTFAARLGSTSHVGDDARRELTAMGLQAPATVSIEIPALIAQDRNYKELVSAIKQTRWKKAKALIRQIPANGHAEIKLVEAKLLHIEGRFDEAIAVHDDKDVRALGKQASDALSMLYSDCGDEDKAMRFAVKEIQEGLEASASFDNLADHIARLAKMGKMDMAFDACASLFRSNTSKPSDGVRSAADVKSERGSSHFTPAQSLRFRQDFHTRASELEANGQHAQAALLRAEADALKSPEVENSGNV